MINDDVNEVVQESIDAINNARSMVKVKAN